MRYATNSMTIALILSFSTMSPSSSGLAPYIPGKSTIAHTAHSQLYDAIPQLGQAIPETNTAHGESLAEAIHMSQQHVFLSDDSG